MGRRRLGKGRARSTWAGRTGKASALRQAPAISTLGRRLAEPPEIVI